MPDLNRLAGDYKNKLVVLAISDEERNDIIEYAAKNQTAMTSGYLPQGSDAESLFRDLQSRPVSFVIDRNGVIRDVVLGATGYDHLVKAVTPYL